MEAGADVASAVKLYRSLGLTPLPVAPGRKSPARPGWTRPAEWTWAAGENVGLLLGAAGQLADVDVDDLTAAAVAELTDWSVVVPGAAVARFGRASKRVSHLVVRQPGAVPRKYLDPESHKVLVEVRGNGQQTLAPPSLHPSGERLEWVDDPSALGRQSPPGTAETIARFIAVASVLATRWSAGVRHEVALGLTGWLLEAGWSEDATRELVRVACVVAQDPEPRDRLRLVDDTLEALRAGEPVAGLSRIAEYLGPRVASALRRMLDAPTATARDLLTDEVVALKVLEAGNLKWCSDVGRWLRWTGTLWEESDDSAVVAELQKARAELARGEQLRAALKSYESYPRIRAVIEVAKRLPVAQVRWSETNSDPWLLNCQNGVVDLRTGRLLPHDRAYLMTKSCAVHYDERAEARLMLDMLKRSTGSEAIVDYLQLAAGLTAIGLASKNVIVVYGPTNTGKTTFLTKCLAGALGTYAVELPAWALSAHVSGGEQAVWLVGAVGARLAVVSEPPESTILDPGVIKKLSGDNVVVARRLYHMPFQFKVSYTVWVDTNYKPLIPEVDDAIWSRLKLVHFKNQVSSPGDPGWIRDFEQKLLAELPGVLAWIVVGAVRVAQAWGDHHGSVSPPPEVLEETEEWRAEEDVVQEFINDEVVESEGEVLPKDALWRRFQEWWKRSVYYNRRPIGKTTLASELRRRGWVESKKLVGGSRRYVWLGKSLRRRESPEELKFD